MWKSKGGIKENAIKLLSINIPVRDSIFHSMEHQNHHREPANRDPFLSDPKSAVHINPR